MQFGDSACHPGRGVSKAFPHEPWKENHEISGIMKKQSVFWH
ncbi:Uncharacterized protein dnm_072930 [Desulfonema magnum]|uniref:Uncharacterized protein n=1 Tax=Desulfonema magnum TaxID=45655 RepID=A0A975GRP2_9BACT|nr:Uncharacterized protein dnm_072930 [Desulfonema magnum]